jgi:hypothetical protein
MRLLAARPKHALFTSSKLSKLDEILGDLGHALLAFVYEEGWPVDEVAVDLTEDQ